MLLLLQRNTYNIQIMANSTKLFLMRHGETLWNTERRLQGHKDSKLTSKGRKQAHRNAVQLRNIVEGVPRFIASPLGRCRETAEIVAHAIDFDIAKIEYDKRVMEISFGQWEGQRKTDIEINDSVAFQARLANRWDVPAPGGESYSMVAQRLRSWLRDVEGHTLILVSHGCAGRILRGIYSNLEKEKIYSLDEPHDAIYQLENNTVTRVV